MATPERAEPPADTVSMRELLASCAAANAVSTPPRERNTAAAGDEQEGEHHGGTGAVSAHDEAA